MVNSQDIRQTGTTRAEDLVNSLPQVFAAHGWAPKHIRFLVAEAERHHRPPPVPRWLMLAMRLFFRNQRAAMRENYGYALMERKAPGSAP